MATMYEMVKELVLKEIKALGQQTGIMYGKVTGRNPENHTVTVNIPAKHGEDEQSIECAYGSGSSSSDHGIRNLPEVDDQVMVFHLDGQPDKPVAIGSAWRELVPYDKITTTKDDADTTVTAETNDWQIWRTRTHNHLAFSDEDGKQMVELRTSQNHVLSLNDESGKERIELYDKDRKQWLEVNVPDKKITLQTDTGEILIKAKTKITMECEDFILNASKTITVESGTTSDWTAGGALTWKTDAAATYESSSGTTIKGSKIDLNP